jgi:hypothetical protein
MKIQVIFSLLIIFAIPIAASICIMWFLHDANLLLFVLTMLYWLLPAFSDKCIEKFRFESEWGQELGQTKGSFWTKWAIFFLSLTSVLGLASMLVFTHWLPLNIIVTPFPYMANSYLAEIFYVSVFAFYWFILFPIANEYFYRMFLAYESRSFITRLCANLTAGTVAFFIACEIMPFNFWICLSIGIFTFLEGWVYDFMMRWNFYNSMALKFGITWGIGIVILVLQFGVGEVKGSWFCETHTNGSFKCNPNIMLKYNWENIFTR